MPNEKVFARAFGIRGKRWITPGLFVKSYQIGHDPVAHGVYEYPLVLELRTPRAGFRAPQDALIRLSSFLEESGGASGRVVYSGYGNPYTLAIGRLKVVGHAGDTVTLCSVGSGIRRYDIPSQGKVPLGPVPKGLGKRKIRVSDAAGLSGDGVVRRNASTILRIDLLYHVWYRREGSRGGGSSRARAGQTSADRPTTTAQIWTATSPDGRRWTERGPVIAPSRGAWHSRRRGAPHVVEQSGQFFMFFSCSTNTNDDGRAVVRAISERPEGPYRVTDTEPVLAPTLESGTFDCVEADHPCILQWGGGLWLYFSGRNSRIPVMESRVGVAMSSKVTGRFKRRRSPVMTAPTSCLWTQGDAVVLISNSTPGSLQYSRDGLRFRRVCEAELPIMDPGVFSSDVVWGLGGSPRDPGLVRFDLG